jgi:putative ABC transport system permease protein
MDAFVQDVRYALRTLARAPGFTAVVVLTLGLGIGATAAVFGVLDRTIFRPLPVAAPDRLVHVVLERPGPSESPGDVNINSNLSYPSFVDLQTRTTAFAAVVAHVEAQLAMEAGGQTERIDAAGVSAGFFTTLGASLALGRDIREDEDRPGAPVAVVVLGHALWQRSFAGDPAILGRAVTLDGKPYTVIGVASPAFAGITRGAVTDAYVPLATITSAGDNAFGRRTLSWLDVFARLAPGVSREQSAAAATVLSRQLESAGLMPAANRFLVEDGSHGLQGLVSELARPLAVLMAAVLLVLVVACANVASLVVVRATARRREISIRIAIGAGRRRLVRQLATESLVLATLGGAAGLLAAVWIAGLMPAVPTLFGAPLAIARGIDGRMLAFTALVATLAALAVGLFPAWRASRTDLLSGLKDGAATAGRDRLSGRDALVAMQVAITFVLVVGAGLLVRTARSLRAVDPGYDPRNVLLAGVDLESRGWRGVAIVHFWNEVLERLRANPEVRAASVTLTMVPTPGGSRWNGVPLEGYPETDDVEFDANSVGPEYFAALRIPVVAGRAFDERDGRGAQRVAVINETMARRYWAGRSPLGLHIGDSLSAMTVIGVVRDGRYRSLREAPRAVVYFSALQDPVSTGTLVVRTRHDPIALFASVRQVVRAVDPNVPLFNVRTLNDHLALASARERLVAAVSVLFGSLALVLSLVGLSGLLAYVVSRRTGEIGLRMALGAQPRDVRAMILRRGMALAAVGLALGIGLATLLGRFTTALLYGVAPVDPVSYAALLLVTSVAAMASALPARRAAHVDPMAALRTE